MMAPPAATTPTTTPGEPRVRDRHRAEAVLCAHHRSAQQIPGWSAEPAVHDAALATALMELFRETGDAGVFECLMRCAGPALFARVRSRLRSLGAGHDPHEVLQDAFVNIYRYPDRFRASRPGAFAAWSSAIVDNAIRRQLRSQRRGVALALRPTDILQEQADPAEPDPSAQVEDAEERAATARAFAVLLQGYLVAFAALSDRERFVLEMVEVRRLRYVELAGMLGIRAEAIKMVVFRARKRIFDRIECMLSRSA